MDITNIILSVIALGAVLGGIDCILSNRFGLGDPFQQAFQLLGPIGLSMAGILCLAPLAAGLLEKSLAPLFLQLGLDPGILGSVIAIDMGGYSLSMALARDAEIGRFSGILASATFGCTLVFTIPVGFSTIEEEDHPFFTRGILLGIGALAPALLLGGLAMELPFITLLYCGIPIWFICALLIWGLLKAPRALAKAFGFFAKGIRMVAIAGLTLGAVRYMTGFTLFPAMTPLEDAMAVVCSIGIVMLGSLPLAQLLQTLLKKPLAQICRGTGLNAVSITGILIGFVSVTPALVMLPRMDNRGKVVCAASLVCGASCLAAHLGYTVSAEPQMVPALLLCKTGGAVLGAAIALLGTKKP